MKPGDAADTEVGEGDEHVVLVDEDDRELGTAPKLSAHREGRLHRAFSVFVFDAAGRLMLQRRADGKYHSGGLWSNTCCSHPTRGADVALAAHARLRYEMGVTCRLDAAFRFLYRADVGSGLVEHELDHVFVGRYDGDAHPNPSEVGAWRWIDADALEAELRSSPEDFTLWLPIALCELRERGFLPESSPNGRAD